MVVTVDGVEMLKVDAHTHILPATAWPETPGVKLRCIHEAEGPFAARLEWEDGRLFRKITKSCFDATAVLEECDAHGVDVQVLCTVPVMFNYHLEPEVGKGWARFLNDDMAATVKVNPKRLIGLGTLPLQDPAAAVVEHVERVVVPRGVGALVLERGAHHPAVLASRSLVGRGEQRQEVAPAVQQLGRAPVDRRRLSKARLKSLSSRPGSLGLLYPGVCRFGFEP